MARKRFNAAEREIIAAGPGTRVEWQNVTQWHPARLVTGDILTDDGWQSVQIRTLTSTRTFSAGRVIGVSPGHIRRPAVPGSGISHGRAIIQSAGDPSWHGGA